MNTLTGQLNWWDRIMAAISFAEEGEADTARELLDRRIQKQPRPEVRPSKESEKRAELRV